MIEVGRLWRCLVLLDVTSMRSVLMYVSFDIKSRYISANFLIVEVKKLRNVDRYVRTSFFRSEGAMFKFRLSHYVMVVCLEFRFLDTEVDGSKSGISMLCPWAQYFFRIASVEPFGGVALKNHTFFHVLEVTLIWSFALIDAAEWWVWLLAPIRVVCSRAMGSPVKIPLRFCFLLDFYLSKYPTGLVHE